MKKNSIYFLGLISLVIICCFMIYNIITKVDEKENNSNILGNLIVHYIDVGQGDATFIELPNKETMLIDTGEKSEGKKFNKYINE